MVSLFGINASRHNHSRQKLERTNLLGLSNTPCKPYASYYPSLPLQHGCLGMYLIAVVVRLNVSVGGREGCSRLISVNVRILQRSPVKGPQAKRNIVRLQMHAPTLVLRLGRFLYVHGIDSNILTMHHQPSEKI